MGQPYKRHGLGAVNDYTGETLGLCRHGKRRQGVVEPLQVWLDKPSRGSISVAWEHVHARADDRIAAVVRTVDRLLVLLSLPTDSPWPSPIHML